MPQEAKKVRKTLRYWFDQLLNMGVDDITVVNDWAIPGANKITPTQAFWCVYVGDHASHADYWRPQPTGSAQGRNLAKVIPEAIAKYRESEREFLMKELAK